MSLFAIVVLFYGREFYVFIVHNVYVIAPIVVNSALSNALANPSSFVWKTIVLFPLSILSLIVISVCLMFVGFEENPFLDENITTFANVAEIKSVN